MATKAVKRWTEYAGWDALPVMLTVEEVCAVLKITQPTALKLLNNGDIPACKMAGQWRISKNSLRDTVEYNQPDAVARIDTLCGIVRELLDEVRQMNTRKAG